MRPETPIIAVLLGSFMFVGLFTVFWNIGKTYSEEGYTVDMSNTIQVNNNSVSLSNMINYANETKTISEEMQKKVNSVKPSFSLSDTKTLGTLGYDVLKQLLNGLLMIKDLVNTVTQVIGVDVSIFLTILIILFLITIVMIIMGVSYT